MGSPAGVQAGQTPRPWSHAPLRACEFILDCARKEPVMVMKAAVPARGLAAARPRPLPFGLPGGACPLLPPLSASQGYPAQQIMSDRHQ